MWEIFPGALVEGRDYTIVSTEDLGGGVQAQVIRLTGDMEVFFRLKVTAIPPQ